jgi:hypothetical protein
MVQTRRAQGLRRVASLAAAVVAVLSLGGLDLRSAGAQTFTATSDDWKGSALDLTKWRFTVMGDAQLSEHSAEIQDGALKIIAGGSDIWGDTDHGVFLWQPANGDFEATLEIRSVKRIGGTTPIGIMVRPSTDAHSAEVMVKAVPIGTHLHYRSEYGGGTGPGTTSSGSLPWGDGTGNGPTIHLRLTRTGNKFVASRSNDGGKTWGTLHDADNPDKDMVEVDFPDDVLVGIATAAVFSPDLEDKPTTEAIVGPFTFTQIATRPTTNGLINLTAVDDKGEPAPGAFLIVKDKDGNDIGITNDDALTAPGPPTSNTGSFFLPPGTYTVVAGETDLNSAGLPMPFEIKTAQAQDLKVKVGAKK